MSKVKMALLGMLVVYAVSIVASASASAAAQEFWDCQEKMGGQWNNSHCTTHGAGAAWETKGVRSAEPETFEGTSETSELVGSILKIKTLIDCQRDEATGALLENGASEGEVKFTNCHVYISGKLQPECKVTEPVLFKYRDQLIHNATTGAIEDELKGVLEEGTTFVAITIGGAGCKVAATFKVKGTQVCELPEARTSLVTHQMVCKPSGSNLKIGEEPATFNSNEHITLINGLQWGAA